MNASFRADAIALGIVLLIAAAVAVSGLAVRLGAHPWWAVRVVLIGAGAGAAAFVALRLAGARLGAVRLLGLIGVAAAGAAAWIGKARFAASYAEDAAAGRAWFFGWIVASAAAVLLVTALLRRC